MKLLPHLPSPSPRPRPARHDPRRVTCHGQFPRRTWRRASLYTLLSSCKTTENTRVSSHGAGAMSRSTGGSHTSQFQGYWLWALYICLHISTVSTFQFSFYSIVEQPISPIGSSASGGGKNIYVDATSICDEILRSQNCKLWVILIFYKIQEFKGTPIYWNSIYCNEEHPCKVMRSLQSHFKKERRLLTLTTHNSRLISQEAGWGDLGVSVAFRRIKDRTSVTIEMNLGMYENEVWYILRSVVNCAEISRVWCSHDS